MKRFNRCQALFAALSVVCSILPSSGFAQLSGVRGGVYGAQSPAEQSFQELDPARAQSVVMVEGKSKVTIKPSELRIVLAVTFEASSPRECKESVEQKIAQLRPQWNQIGIANDSIVEDFISILPRYEIEMTKLGGQEVAMEKKTGFVMQTNVHLAVKDDAEAMKALDVAFANDVADIIGFDYWSDELDQQKEQVRVKAIQTAKAKAELLLGLFGDAPPVINVQEHTVVIYPESMYESVQNAAANEYQTSYYNRRNLPLIKLPRPRNTYYRGSLSNADTQTGGLPMRAELSVISTVRIYYQSPAADTFNAGRKD